VKPIYAPKLHLIGCNRRKKVTPHPRDLVDNPIKLNGEVNQDGRRNVNVTLSEEIGIRVTSTRTL